MQTLAFINLPGGWEWIAILGLGLLLFGRRLPEVGRSMGLGITEFKKGLKGISDEVKAEPAEGAAVSGDPAKLDPPTDQSGQDVRVSQRDAVE